MKHLKKFENENKPYEITIINFTYGEDVKALYVDGKLETYGDYQSHMDEWIDGFINGMRRTAKKSVIYDKKSYIYCENDELNQSIVESGGKVPDTLDDYEAIINGKNMGLL